jgi:hypothetical protein
MGHSEYDPGAKERRPWNAGRKLGAKRALRAEAERVEPFPPVSTVFAAAGWAAIGTSPAPRTKPNFLLD